MLGMPTSSLSELSETTVQRFESCFHRDRSLNPAPPILAKMGDTKSSTVAQQSIDNHGTDMLEVHEIPWTSELLEKESRN